MVPAVFGCCVRKGSKSPGNYGHLSLWIPNELEVAQLIYEANVSLRSGK